MTAPSYRSALMTYLAPQRGRVGLLFAVLAGSIGLQLAVPQILRRFIDSSLAGAGTGALTGAGIAYLAVGLVNQALDAATTYLGADVGWKATNAVRRDLAEHLLGLDMGFHTGTTPGEVIERVDGDVTAVSQFLSRFTVTLLGAFLLLGGVLVVAWLESAWMGAALTGYVVCIGALLVRMRHLAVSAAEEERETSARLYGFVEERLAGLDDIRANGAGSFTMHRFVPVMQDFFTRTVAAWRKRVVLWVTANTGFWAGDALALAVGVWLVEARSLTVGTAYLLLQYVQLVRRPIEQVTQELQELQKASGGLVRIEQLRRLESRLSSGGSRTLPAGPLSVEFAGVEFAYEQAPILRGIDFHLAPGRVLGLLGRTGGGKTTITRLIARLYDPDRGTVRLGGVDLRECDPGLLRRAVGVVSQEVQLFGATVRDNLTFYDASRPDAELLAVLDAAGLGKWIRRVGLGTVLGSAGAGLSAGEQQLVAFARVFLQDPGVVILDEPSSRLDPATEAMLAAATERLFSGRTVVIVAHRLETVRLADEIMVVEEGVIAEHGERATLAADPDSRYARLLAAGRGRELT
jgi:ABC-type multidrug transport system fused ATPase/permease subunit